MTDPTDIDALIADNRKWVQLHRENKYQREAAKRMTCVLDALESTLAERQERDRQVAERAWDEGQKAGLLRADFEYGVIGYQHVRGNPYRAEAARHRNPQAIAPQSPITEVRHREGKEQ